MNLALIRSPRPILNAPAVRCASMTVGAIERDARESDVVSCESKAQVAKPSASCRPEGTAGMLGLDKLSSLLHYAHGIDRLQTPSENNEVHMAEPSGRPHFQVVRILVTAMSLSESTLVCSDFRQSHRKHLLSGTSTL